MNAVGAYFATATFTDGSTVSFNESDIVVFVGPNNSGKSAALRALRDLLQRKTATLVVVNATFTTRGSSEELVSWLAATTYFHAHPGNPVFVLGAHETIDANRAKYSWKSQENGLDVLGRFFCRHLDTTSRLSAANPPQNIPLTTSGPQHPIHYLQRDDTIEKRASSYFRQAFGEDLIIHHNPGSTVPLYCGERPALQTNEDRVSARYLRELEKLPRLETQGDGMRSFVGVILHAIIGHHTIVLIDEPEAFLHPPQARLLGKMLARETPGDRQLFIATHSPDVLNGLLDANRGNVRVIRLTREANVNRVRQLNTAEVRNLWADPLLRHSDVLAGLFHEKVVVCESDADCRFYAAILDGLYEDEEIARQDIQFVHCGGKGRIAMVVSALRGVGVPVCAVCDFDILNDEVPLRPVFEALGGTWSGIANDWRTVKISIESKKPELSTDEVRKDIKGILETLGEATVFPKHAAQQIQAVLRRSSPWATAKTIGKAVVPAGDPHTTCNRLFGALTAQGLFVVESGELEAFARSVGGHGPQWVNGVLPKVVSRDAELQAARDFVKRIVA